MRSRVWMGQTRLRWRRYFTTTAGGLLLVELRGRAELRRLAGDLVGRAGSRLGAHGLWAALWVLTGELVLLQGIEGGKK